MPRLVNRGNAASSSSATSLPPYQPPACPLNDVARRSLGELSNRGTAIYESQLKESVRFLGLGLGDLHERLRAQQERLENQRARRQEKGTDKTVEEERLEAHLEELEPVVDGLTAESEQAIRDIIDKRAELEDEAAALGDLYTAASTTHNTNAAAAQRRALNVEDQDEEDDQKEDPVPSTADALRERRAQKLAEYTSLGPHQRYALNNDYAGFKKLWHDAAAGADGPPLPDASRWFRSNGEPVMDRPGAEQRRNTQGGEDDDDDDDVAVAREVLSLNCPLTLRPMEEPYSNNKCKHTFEKSAILDYLSRQGQMQCPQTGCSQTFSKAKFEVDFYLDQAILRRVQRAREAQRNDEMDDDEEDEEEEESVVVRGGRRARGKAPKQEAVDE